VRGAANKICQAKDAKIICAHSSGNHAQAVAFVGTSLGIQSKIIMPADTPQIKKNAVREYGAEII
jgi:threonine dehydratase